MKTNQFKTVVLSVFVAVFLFSCENLFIEKDPGSNHRASFEYLWNKVNEQYSYLELKNIDWDSVYTVYNSKVEDDMPQELFFSLMFDMLKTLEDGHVNLYSPFSVSRYPELAVPDSNYSTRIVRASYLSEQYFVTGPLQHDFIHRIDDNGQKVIDTLHVNGNPNDIRGIGYVRYSSFASLISNYDIDYVISRYGRSTAGLIIDVRSNGGGSPLNIFQLCERFIPADAGETTLYYSRNKVGPGEDDFDDWVSATISPSGLYYPEKIIVLTDRSCYSATSYFATAMKAVQKLRDVKIIGVPTGGGLGAPRGGQLPNGWYYRMSVTQTRSVDGDLDFELGVPPDIYQTQNPADTQKNIDTILEMAIEEIKHGQW
ncbi:S41 family peptidase [Flammeovirga sp. OC4]|uniref:S41 family peptidase n=1 Tax=Flammeovirga sp. OC4 TaxID=1382345 RepID=UPI000693791C|nr:S41 family peptidase [Flammeovirga sp. OC4]